MSGIFPFKTTGAADITISPDSGGTVQGIDIALDALGSESLAANISRFQTSILTPLGLSTSGLGLLYDFSSGADTFTLQLRQPGLLFDFNKMVGIARVVKYIKDQTIVKDVATLAIANSINTYIATKSVTPAATFVTQTPAITGPLTLNYVTTASTDVTGTNEFVEYMTLWQYYVQNILKIQVIGSSNYVFGPTPYVPATTFTVTITTSGSDLMESNVLHICSGATSFYSWFNATIGGLKALAT